LATAVFNTGGEPVVNFAVSDTGGMPVLNFAVLNSGLEHRGVQHPGGQLDLPTAVLNIGGERCPRPAGV
jgi:hypothetical protein